MAARIDRTAGPQPVGEQNGEFRWAIPLSAAPSREWLKFFNTPLEAGDVCMPSLVTFQPREMTFAAREELIKDWVQAIDQWIATANERVADAEQQRWQTHERQQRGVEETKTRLTEADKYRGL
jgi:hypothetical protein